MSTLRVKELKSVNSDPITVNGNLIISGTVTADEIKIGSTVINPAGCCVDILNVTYETLRILMNTNGLKKGFLYKIVNFRTCYDQPDFDSIGQAITTSSTFHQAAIDPIIVLATSTNTIDSNVFQPSYPKDVLKYDVYWDQTEITQSKARGRITERIDQYGNRTDYDHRTILFKRYRSWAIENLLSGKVTMNGTNVINGVGCDFNSELSVGSIIQIFGLNYQVISILGPNTMIVEGNIYLTTNFDEHIYTSNLITTTLPYGDPYLNYKNNNLVFDNNNFVERFTFKIEEEIFLYGDVYSVNNYIGDYAYSYTPNNTELFRTIENKRPIITKIINSIVITSTTEVISTETTESGITFNLLVTEISGDTTEYLDIVNNEIVSGITINFSENSYEKKLTLYENVLPYIIDRITGTTINNLPTTCKFGFASISGSTIIPFTRFLLSNNVFDYKSASNNILGNSYNNSFGFNSVNNNGGFNFINNRLPIFYNNTIDNDFTDNTIDCTFGYNTIGNRFISNVFSSSSFNLNNFNTFGTETVYNYVINTLFLGNKISVNFMYNTIVNTEFQDNSIDMWFAENEINSNAKNSLPSVFYDNRVEIDFIQNNLENFNISTNIFGSMFAGNTIKNSSSFTNNNFVFCFLDNYIDVNEFSLNNFFSTAWSNNFISPYVVTNKINLQFNLNSIYNSFSENSIDSFFQQNRINNQFFSNNIGKNFIFNEIHNTFKYNKIDGLFFSNIIRSNFEDNQIGIYFAENTIGGGVFNRNNIGPYMRTNTIDIQDFGRNTILNTFVLNTISTYTTGTTLPYTNTFIENLISFDFSYNVFIQNQNNILSFFQNVINGCCFQSNLITDTSFGRNTFNSFFQRNTIDVIQMLYNEFNSPFTDNSLVKQGYISYLYVDGPIDNTNFNNSNVIYNNAFTRKIFVNLFGLKRIGYYDSTDTFITANVNA